MRTYECPECGQRFDYLHMSSSERPPSYCAQCGAFVGNELEPEISAPKIAKTALMRAVDDVYTGMESSSAARAEMAAQDLGVDASETAALKVTDLQTGLRQGDSSMAPVNNDVSRLMAANPGIVGLQAPDAAAQFAADSRKGPYAGAGNKMRESIVSKHRSRASQVERAGNVGRYNG